MEISDMRSAIEHFIEAYDGTSIGEHIKNWYDNTSKNDFEQISDIFSELEGNGYV